MESLNLMMKWGYGYSKQFIGGNPLQKNIKFIKRGEGSLGCRFKSV